MKYTAQMAFDDTLKLLKAYKNGDLHGGDPMCHIKKYAKLKNKRLLKKAFSTFRYKPFPHNNPTWKEWYSNNTKNR